MAYELASAAENAPAAWVPPHRRRRTIAERLTLVGIIGVLHAGGILLLWTRHLMKEPEPAPLLLATISSAAPQPPPSPSLRVPLSVPQVTMAAALPPTLELIEDPPSAASIARDSPVELAA